MKRTVQIDIAAPMEVVWECLTDDDKIGQWDAELISRQSDGSILISQFGRTRPARITTVSEVPPKKLERLYVTPAYRSSEVIQLEPIADGTRVVINTERGRRGALRLLFVPYGPGSKRLLRACLSLLRLHAETIALTSSANLLDTDSREDLSRIDRRTATLLRKSSTELARVWSESSRVMRESIRYSWLAGLVCPDPRGAQLTRAIATTYWSRKYRMTSLAISILALVSFTVLTVLMVASGRVFSAILWGALTLFYLSLIYVAVAQLWPSLLAAIHDNNEWLDNHERIEALIDRSSSSELRIRRETVAELGAVECLGPLNLRAEAALERLTKDPDEAIASAAAAGLANRRQRVLAAVSS